ncbi:MAG: STAS domain-containing protein [Okeania sp. SIO3I5]|uniref:STAS domain-containing protein n=1 Tax=Okeania sp. SIO3I5 TaxID=2607805 RepID=UPI0013BC7F02|nr:STAS domain-containing protein [Okeania sp. SIO3I5]NEQ38171.1 STAS domain-containing protein [Okeania sp. SIO3I5]
MALLIRPAGAFNEQNSSLIQKKLQKTLASRSEHCCVIDLATIDSINNHGLITLVALRRIANSNGCKLYLMNLNDPVKYCLELTGLDRIFEVKQRVRNRNYAKIAS